MLTPLGAFRDYMALKAHFYGRYDYEKHAGHLKNTASTDLEKRHDRFSFNKLAKKGDDLFPFLIANFIVRDYWVGDLNTDRECEKNYSEFLKRNDALEYHFMGCLAKMPEDFNSWFDLSDGHPPIMRAYISGDVSLEFLVIILDITDARGYLDKRLRTDPIWPEISKRVFKYKTFFKYDEMTYRRIINSKFQPS